MTCPLDGTLGSLVGRLDVLRVECWECRRSGRYSVAKLVGELGPGYRLTDWLSERTRDCPNKQQTGVTRACGAIMPDLARVVAKRSTAKPPAAVPIDGGAPCPQCGGLMQRYMRSYGDGTTPVEWNHCRPCKEGRWSAQKARTRGVRALGFKNYEAYIASPYWQSVRQRVLEAQRTRLQRNVCESCGKEGVEFDVHHKSYDRLGNELIEDCQVICEQCHDKLHGRDAKSQSRHYANR
jgi:hypothetical protein